MDFNVLPECYIDTKLVKILVPPRTNYNHQKGTNVLKKMAEQLADEFALGIVDEDVEDRQYAQQFQLLYDHPGCLRLLKHPNRPHFLIYLCPAVEKWIISRADEAAISLTDFGLPYDFDKLRKLSKTSKSEDKDPYSDNFQRLFKALRQANPPAVAVLTFWISHLKDYPYTANLAFLQAETARLLRQNT